MHRSEHSDGPAPAAAVANDFSGSASVVGQFGRVYGDVHFGAPLPVERPVPHQVPAGNRWFANRRLELAALDAAYDPAARGRVVLLTGGPGFGKTELVRHWSASAEGRFTGGELYLDLAATRSSAAVSTAVGDALAEGLLGLGVAEASLPTTLAARASMFRTRTATAPVLVVLDDVGEAAHVRSLIPTAPGSMVVATCGRRLEELVGLDGADLHVVEPLDAGHALELLSALCPAQVAAADPADVRMLVDLCGGVPIALRVAAARLRTDRGLRLVDLVEQVRADLGALALGEDTSVTAVLTATYRVLPADAQRVYRIFGAAEGLELTGPAVAAALDVTPEAAGAVLSVLLATNLVEERPGHRYRWYALTARHAADQAAGDPDQGVEPALRRLVRSYLVGAMTADVTVMGDRLRYGRLDQWSGETRAGTVGADPAAQADAAEKADTARSRALRWLAAERHNLRHTVHLAVRLDDDVSAWQLTEALAALYLNRRSPAELVQVCVTGIGAALRLGRGEVAARLRCLASRGYTDLGQLTEARTCVDAALAFADDGRYPRLLASVWEFRGRVAAAEGDLPGAVTEFRRSLAANEAIGEARGAAIARYFLGCALDTDRRPDEALEPLAVAEQALREANDDRMAARVRLATGEALAHLGRAQEARVALREAVAVFAALDLRHYEVQGLSALAGVAVRLGDPAEARQCLARARTLVDEADPRVPQLRADLAALPATDSQPSGGG